MADAGNETTTVVTWVGRVAAIADGETASATGKTATSDARSAGIGGGNDVI